MKRLLTFLIVFVLPSCAALSPKTTARKCYDGWMSLGHAKTNQYESCPVVGSEDAQGIRPHYDDGSIRRSQVGFGVGDSPKSALDAAILDAKGSIPVHYDSYRKQCDSNISGWECAVVIEWHNPNSSLDYFIEHKKDKSAIINYCEAHDGANCNYCQSYDHGTCIQGDGTRAYIYR